MLKNKIIKLDNGSVYYIGNDIIFDNGEHYCCASLYNEETQDCEDNFNIFKIENIDKDFSIVPVKDVEMAKYVMSIIANKS